MSPLDCAWWTTRRRLLATAALLTLSALLNVALATAAWQLAHATDRRLGVLEADLTRRVTQRDAEREYARSQVEELRRGLCAILDRAPPSPRLDAARADIACPPPR